MMWNSQGKNEKIRAVNDTGLSFDVFYWSLVVS